MEKKISSFQIILLAVFGAVGVGAVLIFALAVGGNSNSAVGSVTIWGTFDQSTMTTVLRTAADSDTQLAQVTYIQKDPTTYEANLANALASGTGPDLIIMSQDEAIHDGSKVYPILYSRLSQSDFENTFVGAANPFLSTSGTLGLPILVDPLVLYWNRDMLASAGIAQPPQYWDELSAMSQAITKTSDDGTIKTSTIALGTYTNIDSAKDIIALLIMQAGGSVTTLDSSGHLIAGLSQGGSASGAAQSALNFYTEFANPSQATYTWSQALPDARQAFAAGNLAMYIGYASEEPLIRATNPNLNFAVAPVPQVRNTKTSIDEGRVYALSIPRNAHNPQGALTVAFLLDAADVGSDLSVALGIPSARRDVLSSAIAQNGSGDDTLFSQMALITRTWNDPDPSQTGGIFQAMIEDTESGAVQLPAAIQRADQQIGNLLGL
jgi:ABC-type glycerol-3-phosphate transport system substrate-binding protein